MYTIKKADFAEHIRKRFGFSLSESERLVNVIFTEITESLARGERVMVANFGTFNINHKRERAGRNPKTGEPATITARRVPTFKPSAEFRNLLKK